MPAPVAFLKYKHDSSIPEQWSGAHSTGSQPTRPLSLIVFNGGNSVYPSRIFGCQMSHSTVVKAGMRCQAAARLRLILLCQDDCWLRFLSARSLNYCPHFNAMKLLTWTLGGCVHFPLSTRCRRRPPLSEMSCGSLRFKLNTLPQFSHNNPTSRNFAVTKRCTHRQRECRHACLDAVSVSLTRYLSVIAWLMLTLSHSCLYRNMSNKIMRITHS